MVRKENIIGKVIAVIPYIGYLAHFVRTPIGFILLIVIPATIIIILEIKNLTKEIKRKAKNEQISSLTHKICLNNNLGQL